MEATEGAKQVVDAGGRQQLEALGDPASRQQRRGGMGERHDGWRRAPRDHGADGGLGGQDPRGLDRETRHRGRERPFGRPEEVARQGCGRPHRPQERSNEGQPDQEEAAGATPAEVVLRREQDDGYDDPDDRADRQKRRAQSEQAEQYAELFIAQRDEATQQADDGGEPPRVGLHRRHAAPRQAGDGTGPQPVHQDGVAARRMFGHRGLLDAWAGAACRSSVQCRAIGHTRLR